LPQMGSAQDRQLVMATFRSLSNRGIPQTIKMDDLGETRVPRNLIDNLAQCACTELEGQIEATTSVCPRAQSDHNLIQGAKQACPTLSNLWVWALSHVYAFPRDTPWAVFMCVCEGITKIASKTPKRGIPETSRRELADHQMVNRSTACPKCFCMAGSYLGEQAFPISKLPIPRRH
jgi:hypothetical protein